MSVAFRSPAPLHVLQVPLPSRVKRLNKESPLWQIQVTCWSMNPQKHMSLTTMKL